MGSDSVPKKKDGNEPLNHCYSGNVKSLNEEKITISAAL